MPPLPPKILIAASKRKATESDDNACVPAANITKKRQESTPRLLIKMQRPRNPECFDLLFLPRELRDKVYGEIFQGDIKIGSPYASDPRYGHSTPACGRNLAVSCRQVLREIKEHLIRSKSIIICLGPGKILNSTHAVTSAFLKQVGPEFKSTFYEHGVRVRYEETTQRSVVHNRESPDHPSMAFVTQSLMWTPHVAHWVIETEISLTDSHEPTRIRYVRGSTSAKSPMFPPFLLELDRRAEEEARLEASHWQYVMNEFRRASYWGKWNCTVEDWKWVGINELKVRFRCVKTLPPTGAK